MPSPKKRKELQEEEENDASISASTTLVKLLRLVYSEANKLFYTVFEQWMKDMPNEYDEIKAMMSRIADGEEDDAVETANEISLSIRERMRLELLLQITSLNRKVEPESYLADSYFKSQFDLKNNDRIDRILGNLKKYFGGLTLDKLQYFVDSFIAPICLQDPYIPGDTFDITIQLTKSTSNNDPFIEWISLIEDIGFDTYLDGTRNKKPNHATFILTLPIVRSTLDTKLIDLSKVFKFIYDTLKERDMDDIKGRFSTIMLSLYVSTRSYFDYPKYEYIKQTWPTGHELSAGDIKIIKETNALFDEVITWLESRKGQIIRLPSKDGANVLELSDNRRIMIQETLMRFRDDIVGLYELKKSILELIRNRFKGVDVTFQVGNNFLFVGNPGTGKTEITRKYVSRLIALLQLIPKPPEHVYETINARLKSYLDRNLSFGGEPELPVKYTDPLLDPLIEVKKEDLVGIYQGWTQQITLYRCAQALGRVLFIDEAYNIAKDTSGYGGEAMSTLLTVITEYGQYMSVIMGGYEDQMKTYIYGSNPGFQSRFPIALKFLNYRPMELAKIFMLYMMSNKSRTRGIYWIEAPMKTAGNQKEEIDHIERELVKLFKDDIKTFDESNARGVQNVLKKTIELYQEEMKMVDMEDIVLNGKLPLRIPLGIIKRAIEFEASREQDVKSYVNKAKVKAIDSNLNQPRNATLMG